MDNDDTVKFSWGEQGIQGLEFYDWNPEVFKARDVDLEFICEEDSANIEIMVWEWPLTSEKPQILWLFYVDMHEKRFLLS